MKMKMISSSHKKEKMMDNKIRSHKKIKVKMKKINNMIKKYK